MIVCKELTRTYSQFTAVDQVSFSIEKGEIVGLLGHNGAGKTTIMKMLTGFLEPTAGTITVDGMDVIEDRIKIQQKIGYLPENCPVYPEMTVIDYLQYVCELRGIPEEKQAGIIKNAIDRTQIEQKATDLINTLSRGYRQRVGVAQAIIHNPEILILDEPTNGLDPSQIHDMRSLIRELSKDSTVIISTHILQEVQAICDRVIIILNGEVALDSKLNDLRSSNRYLLSVAGTSEETESSLRALDFVNDVSLLSSNDNLNEFAVEVRQNGHSVAPDIAKTVVEKGLALHALHPERRDLETVFREINSQTKEA